MDLHPYDTERRNTTCHNTLLTPKCLLTKMVQAQIQDHSSSSCPQLMQNDGFLKIQHSRVVKDFKLNLLVLKILGFGLEMKFGCWLLMSEV